MEPQSPPNPGQEHQRRYRELVRRGLGRKALEAELKKLSAEIEALHASNEADEDVIPTLSELVPRVRTKFGFRYDFGDNWEPVVEVEKIAAAGEGVRYPRCTDGARADPIEDIGGAWRLGKIIEIIQHPDDSRRAANREILEWLGGPYDIEALSVEAINERLARMFPGRE
ncbi:MAG: plasmid pRiA4b ORF-3 family protein [Limisphaerales bacterium]